MYLDHLVDPVATNGSFIIDINGILINDQMDCLMN